MQTLDETVVLFFQGLRCEELTVFFSIFIPSETWTFTAIVLVLFSFLRSGVLRVPVISFMVALISSDFCYRAIKAVVHRPRPFMAMHEVVPLISVPGFSFPSGHATVAMAGAMVIAHHFPKSRVPVGVLVLLVVVSRVYFGVHYLSDVLGGMALGAVLGWLSLVVERGILKIAGSLTLRKIGSFKH